PATVSPRRPPPTPHSLPTRRSSDLVRGGLAVLFERDAVTRGGAAHHPAGAVAAAVEAVLVTEAAHDEALRAHAAGDDAELVPARDRKSTRLNASHVKISYAVFCLKK